MKVKISLPEGVVIPFVRGCIVYDSLTDSCIITYTMTGKASWRRFDTWQTNENGDLGIFIEGVLYTSAYDGFERGSFGRWWVPRSLMVDKYNKIIKHRKGLNPLQ